MKTYIVTVQVRTIERYEVEAETPDDAMELWQEGTFLEERFSRMEAEPLSAQAKGERP